MKLNQKTFEDIVVGAEKEMSFSIDTDNSLIFEILRDKMYKDKIGSICREVMSNCRDANREAGTDAKVSVTIIEPDQLTYVGHQSVSFKDSGIGISPDRMADIYVKYASSTKSSNNDQTGGFGLGAKTPFAYNDTFTVITVCDVEGVRIKYFYTALIDSSRKGKMILFDTEDTTEPTGTEVIVPIKTPNDRNEFERKSFYYTKLWGCVEYINFEMDTTPTEVMLDTPKYMVVEGSGASLIIDGIPYPLELGWGTENLSLCRGIAIAMKFETGELTISANRESVQYDEDTVNTIKERSSEVLEDFKKRFVSFLDGLENYLEACKFTTSFKNNSFPMGGKDKEYEMFLSAVGNRSYTGKILSDYFKDMDYHYHGIKTVSKISFKHHTIEAVKDKYYLRKKETIYSLYDSIPLSLLGRGGKIFYADRKKDSRRNVSIFNDNYYTDNTFLLVSPNSLSTDEEVAEELFMMEDLFNLKFASYEKIILSKVISTAVRAKAKIAALNYDGYNGYNTDLFYDKVNKMVYTDQDFEDVLDLDKVCFEGVERVGTRPNYIKREKLDLVRKHGYSVVLVNHKVLEFKLAGVGVNTAAEVYQKIQEENEKEWIEEGKKYILRNTITNVSNGLLHYISILPAGILPKSYEGHDLEELKNKDFSDSYHRVRGKVKVDASGLLKKLKKNLSKYPMLVPYVIQSNDNIETKRENVKQYIKQTNSYEQ